MSQINLDTLLTLPDGSQLVVSTQCSKQGDFSCALYSAVVNEGDRPDFQVISNHLSATTCLNAQEHAYNYAVRLYPTAAGAMKKPPYLIWSGPRSGLIS